LTANAPIATISLVGEIAKHAMNAVFHALSDPTRREIMRLLRRREMTAGEIAEGFPLAKSTLSGHFNVLKNAGLIVAEKNGTSIVYSLNMSVVEQTMAAVMDLFDVGKPTKKGKS
jgi:DNA-binding transcriptional ArsR family regulator